MVVISALRYDALELSPPLMDVADFAGITPLMRAAALGRADLASWLIEQNANTTLTDESQVTAVGHALNAGHLELAKRLVSEGAY